MNTEYLRAYKAAEQKYILSNGIILNQNPAVFDLLKQYGINEVRMSMDFSLQKEMQSVPQNIVQNAMKKATDNDLKVMLSTVITSNNIEDVPEMCDYAFNNGAYAIKFLNYVNSGSAKKENFEKLEFEAKLRFFAGVLDARNTYKKEELEIIVNGNFGPIPTTKGMKLADNNKYCPSGTKMFVIAPNDKVYGCPFLMNYKMGKLTKKGIEINENIQNQDRSYCLTELLV